MIWTVDETLNTENHRKCMASCENKGCKNSGLNSIRSHNPAISVQRSYRLCYQANWELVIVWVRKKKTVKDEYNNDGEYMKNHIFEVRNCTMQLKQLKQLQKEFKPYKIRLDLLKQKKGGLDRTSFRKS